MGSQSKGAGNTSHRRREEELTRKLDNNLSDSSSRRNSRPGWGGPKSTSVPSAAPVVPAKRDHNTFQHSQASSAMVYNHVSRFSLPSAQDIATEIEQWVEHTPKIHERAIAVPVAPMGIDKRFQHAEQAQLIRLELTDHLGTILLAENPETILPDKLCDLATNVADVLKYDSDYKPKDPGKQSWNAHIFLAWLEMHGRVEKFKETTGYKGTSGADWVNHKESLSTWREGIRARQAGDLLIRFGLQQKLNAISGRPCANFESLTDDLTDFFTEITDGKWSSGDEANFRAGLAEYNEKLLSWFDLGSG